MQSRYEEINQFLAGDLDTLVGEILAQQRVAQPELYQRYSPQQISACLQDIKYHLSYLAEALAAAQPVLFIEYISWAQTLFASLHIDPQCLAGNLQVISDVLEKRLPGELVPLAAECIEKSLQALEQPPHSAASHIASDSPLYAVLKSYLDALLAGDRKAASELILTAVQQGTPVQDIYIHVFQPAQYEIGRLWQTGKISVAQEHYCTAVTQMVMSQLYPHIFTSPKNGGKVLAACVPGELHEVGLRMVADVMEMEGWNTLFLGANTPVKSIVQTLTEKGINLLAISATMTFNVGKVSEMMRAVRSSDGCRSVKVMVGGYPFKIAPELWRTIGADGYAGTAAEAIATAQQLCGA
jgi:MerR family transcriptional regulator, light-induced transcriptional regulator